MVSQENLDNRFYIVPKNTVPELSIAGGEEVTLTPEIFKANLANLLSEIKHNRPYHIVMKKVEDYIRKVEPQQPDLAVKARSLVELTPEAAALFEKRYHTPYTPVPSYEMLAYGLIGRETFITARLKSEAESEQAKGKQQTQRQTLELIQRNDQKNKRRS